MYSMCWEHHLSWKKNNRLFFSVAQSETCQCGGRNLSSCIWYDRMSRLGPLHCMIILQSGLNCLSCSASPWWLSRCIAPEYTTRLQSLFMKLLSCPHHMCLQFASLRFPCSSYWLPVRVICFHMSIFSDVSVSWFSLSVSILHCDRSIRHGDGITMAGKQCIFQQTEY